MEITFKKSEKSAAQFVYYDGKLIGSVRKSEAWTTRGTRISWDAFRKGVCVGSAETRAAAAKLLVSA